MTASKPEVVAWRALHCSGDWTLREAPTLPSTGLYTGDIEGLIRLSDHERLQAEAERLQAARAEDKARIEELEAALRLIGRDARKLTSAGVMAIADAALAQQGKEGDT